MRFYLISALVSATAQFTIQYLGILRVRFHQCRAFFLLKTECSCVGYHWAPFKYFQVRFFLQPIPVMVTMIPDRAQRALSIPLSTFFPLPIVASKRAILQKTLKKHQLWKNLARFAHVSNPGSPVPVRHQT